MYVNFYSILLKIMFMFMVISPTRKYTVQNKYNVVRNVFVSEWNYWFCFNIWVTKNVFSQLLEKLKLNKLALSCAKLSSSLSKLSWLLPTSLHISFIGHSLSSVSWTNFIGYPLSEQSTSLGWVGCRGVVGILVIMASLPQPQSYSFCWMEE